MKSSGKKPLTPKAKAKPGAVRASRTNPVDASSPKRSVPPPSRSQDGSALSGLLFEHTPDAVVVHNGKTILLINPAGAKLLGAEDPAQLIARSFLKFVTPPDRAAVLERFADPGRAKNALAPLTRLKRSDGTVIDVEVIETPCSYKNLPASLLIARDVSSRKRREEQLGLLRAILDHSGDAVEVIDPASGRILDVNDTDCRLLGYSREELLSLSIFDVVPGMQRQGFKKAVESLRHQDSMTFEATHHKKNGTLFPVEVTVRLVRLEHEYLLSTARDITTQKRAEEALRHTESRFRAVVEHSWNGITLIDRQNKVIYSSPSNERIIGYSQQERTGRSSMELIHPDDVSRVEQQLRYVAQKPGAFQQVEYRARTKSGAWIWLESVAHNLLDEPDVQATVINFRDITERKLADEQINLQKALLESASEASLDGIAIISKERRWLHHNQRFIEMWSIQPELAANGDSRETVEVTRQQVVNPAEYLANINYLYENIDVSQQDEVHFKDGRIFDRYTGPVWAANGEIYGRIWYCRDITERRRAEETVKSSEARWRAVFDHAGIGIALLDMAGHPIQNNAALQQMLGYNAVELSNMSFADFTHPEDADIDLALFRELAEGKRDKYQIEKRYMRKDGEIIWANMTATALRDDQGRMLIGVGMAEDITQRKRSEQALKTNEAWFRALIENSRDMIRVMDSNGRTIYASPSAERIMGYSAQETLQRSAFELVHPDDLQTVVEAWQRILLSAGPVPGSVETRIRHADGTWHIHEAIGTNLLNNPDVQGFVMNSRDITDRKQAEEQLRDSELRFRTLVEQAPVAIAFTREGMITYANPKFLQIYHVENAESIIGTPAVRYFAPQSQAESLERSRRRKLGLYVPTELESIAMRPDGSQFPIQIAIQHVHLPDGPVNISFVTDITERKHAEQTQARLTAILEATPDFVSTADPGGHITFINRAGRRMVGIGEDESISNLLIPDLSPNWANEIIAEIGIPTAIREGLWTGETAFLARNGHQIPVVQVILAHHSPDGTLEYLSTISHDITDRKRAEETLRESEERFRSLSQAAFEGIMFHENGIIQDANQVFVNLVSAQHLEDLIGKDGMKVLPFDPESQERLRDSLLTDSADPFEITVLRPDGSSFPAETQGRAITFKGRSMRVVAMRDITARKQAEAALNEARNFLQLVVDSSPSMIFVLDAQGRLVFANQYTADYYETTPEALLEKSTSALHYPELEARTFDSDDMKVLRTRERIVKDELNTDSKGKQRWFHTIKTPLVKPDGSVEVLGISTDITDRKRAEEKIQRQLDRLTALSEIDRSITSSFDVRQSLGTLLSHLALQLNVDAADVLLYDSEAQMLEYAAGQGFRSRTPASAPMHIGQGYAGQVIIDRRMLVIHSLKDNHIDPIRGPSFVKESFTSYCGVPLIAKGQITGVLEVFQRTSLEPDRDWFDFLNALAEQAAIAIENATLFSNLQRSNSELSVAYDATIEGWSRALDLRDRETEGHTQRVTNLTIQLGRLLHLSETELVQMRWGALLHDIGKMGVPDGVLFKPGPLIEEEWAIMKKHPVFAYEMLSPIRYLRAALDIPYLHHEKWDGSGYPMGLRGEQIPLAARIFAVADVWDALRSDRPYRPAWPLEKARKHIRSLMGTHFDPAVAEVFLQSDLIDPKKGRP